MLGFMSGYSMRISSSNWAQMLPIIEGRNKVSIDGNDVTNHEPVHIPICILEKSRLRPWLFQRVTWTLARMTTRRSAIQVGLYSGRARLNHGFISLTWTVQTDSFALGHPSSHSEAHKCLKYCFPALRPSF